MRRNLILLLVAACGHTSKVASPPITDPKPAAESPSDAGSPKSAESKPADAKPAAPEPIDIPLASGKTSYKLVSSGKGAKSVVKIDAKAGTKQALELAIDFAGKQVAPPELGGPQEDVAPTLVLASELEAGEADKDGVKFKLTFTGVDAKDRPGAKATKDQFKTELGILIGTVLAGSVSASGQIANTTLHVDKPTDKTMAALELVRISMMPLWPVLPTEAIGTGAKWRVTSTYTIADRLEATRTTDYEVVSHKGSAWELKAATKISGVAQTIKDTKFEKISGAGSFQGTLTDGVFAPTSTTKVTTDFTAHVTGPDAKVATITFHLDQAFAVAAKP